MISIPNTINWRFNKISVSILTHKGWIDIPLKVTKQFINYVSKGWRVSQELKLRLVGRKVLVLRRRLRWRRKKVITFLLTLMRITPP